MDALLTDSADELDQMIAAELPPSWRSELLSGWGDNWGDAEPSWLEPDDN